MFSRSIFFFNWKLNILSFVFLIWTEQFWFWFSQKLKISKFPLFFKVFLILHPVWLLNLTSDLSVDSIVQLGLADTKVVSQDAEKRVLKLTEKWNTQTSEVSSNFFTKICLKHETSFQSLGIHYCSAFYSKYSLSFFCSGDVWI